MKTYRILALILALALALTLAACGGPPSQSGTSAPAITTGSGEASITIDGEEYVGNYEGEYADGLFSGYGVWEFENWRYEGYWENGMPNGDGTLTVLSTIDYVDYGVTLPNTETYETAWENGFASGTLTKTWAIDGTDPHGGDNTHQWVFENLQNGVMPTGMFQCVLCSHESGRWSANGEIIGVPPWSWEEQPDQSSDTPPTQSTGGDTQPTPNTDNQNTPGNGPSAQGDDFEYLLFANAQIIEDAINNQNEYFCPTTDDYITYYDDIFFRPNEDMANEGVDGLRFGIVSFDENGDFASICEKFVFESPELAELFAGTPNRFNPSVDYETLEWGGSTDVFCNRFPETESFGSLPQDKTKSNLITVNIDYYAPRIIIEISKP